MGSAGFTSQEASSVGKMKKDTVLIIGTGALATLFAARFARAGTSVTMLGTWADALAIINDKGVHVKGETKSYPVRATADPNECRGMPNALVLVKSWQTERAAQQLLGCLPEDGVALTLQNGLGNHTILATHLGPQRVLQGVTTLGATLNAPGEVCQGGEGPVSLDSHLRLPAIENVLGASGFDVQVVDDIQRLVWGKLVVSSALNPLTALLRIKNGEILEQPTALGLMGALAYETSSVAKKLGVVLPFKDPQQAVEEVAHRTAENLSSMLQDVLRGAPTEIDAINGAVVQLADKYNLQVPVNRTILSLVKAIPVRGNIKI
jgi:2-dehydropantoate 2-reductase